jgi:hypothetical protein
MLSLYCCVNYGIVYNNSVINSDLHMRFPIFFCPIRNKFGVSLQIFFVKVLNTQFHGEPSNESSADKCGKADARTDGQQ